MLKLGKLFFIFKVGDPLQLSLSVCHCVCMCVCMYVWHAVMYVCMSNMLWFLFWKFQGREEGNQVTQSSPDLTINMIQIYDSVLHFGFLQLSKKGEGFKGEGSTVNDLGVNSPKMSTILFI